MSNQDPIRVYCTASRSEVTLEPGPEVTIYVCGITPYDSMHVGHVALLVLYDVLARVLRERGHRVRLVRNITDIDDPLLPRAQLLGIAYWDLVDQEIRQMASDIGALDLSADVEPRASDHVPQMAATVQELLDAGRAYRLDDRVYFDVGQDPRFGELAGLPAAELERLAADRGGDPERPGKRHPLDFVLWQPSREGEPEYGTVVGRGRPGWHIGCSVMSREHCGNWIDVHGGGDDLIFPHHDSELAQNRAVAGGSQVGVWLHGYPVAYAGHKMSKSLGNVVLARDLLRDHDWQAVRLAVLEQYPYRTGFEWRDEHPARAAQMLSRLRDLVAGGSGPDVSATLAECAEGLRVLDTPRVVRALRAYLEGWDGAGPDPEAGRRVAALGRVLGLNLVADPKQPGRVTLTAGR